MSPAPLPDSPSFSSPLKIGDEVDFFHVKRCAAGKLVLGTQAGCMLLVGFVSLIWTVICCFILRGTWELNSMGYFGSLITGKVFGGFLIGLIFLLVSLANIGRRLIFDGNDRRVASKWFYFVGSYRPISDFASVTIGVSELPANSDAKTPLPGGPPALPKPPRWKLHVLLKAVEKGDIELGSANLSKEKDVGRLIACAIYLNQILKLPVTFTGPIDQLPDSARRMIQEVQAMTAK